MSDTASYVHHLEDVTDYQRFFHTKSYVGSKSKVYKDEKKLMKILSYNNSNKFHIHRNKWDTFELAIPVKYLKEIGVDLNTLWFTVELDQEEYEKALNLPFFPTKAIIQDSLSSFSILNLPIGVCEVEAIYILMKMSSRMHVNCVISLENIKTIYFEPNGRVFAKYYKPIIQITEELVIPMRGSTSVEMITLKDEL